MDKKLLVKIAKARKTIKESSLKKLGRNTHSNYDYYTPDQVSQLVDAACVDAGLINTYDLKHTEFGLNAQVTVWNLEDENSFHVFNMATEIPKITATNAAQQLGGAVTYSERYLLMSIYDIKDNNLDFDTDKGKTNPAPSKGKSNFEARDITKSEVEKWNGKLYSGNSLYINNVKIVVSAEQAERLKTHPNYKPDEKK